MRGPGTRLGVSSWANDFTPTPLPS